MANTPQAKKRAAQAEQHRQRNTHQRSLMRTHLKHATAAIQTKDKTAAETAFNAVVPVLDRMVNKGFIHKNKAARHKSRLSAHLKAL